MLWSYEAFGSALLFFFTKNQMHERIIFKLYADDMLDNFNFNPSSGEKNILILKFHSQLNTLVAVCCGCYSTQNHQHAPVCIEWQLWSELYPLWHRQALAGPCSTATAKVSQLCAAGSICLFTYCILTSGKSSHRITGTCVISPNVNWI